MGVKSLDEFVYAMPLPSEKPPVQSPEFRPYLEAAVSSSKSIREAAQKLGYRSPKTVRYHLKRFGMRIPDHWYLRPNPRPSARGPAFKTYFEGVVKSSKGPKDAAETMGYSSPTTVLYHMKRLGIEGPESWYARPLPNSPEFRSYFEKVVNTSQSMTEAVRKLGYTRPQSVRYNLRRFRMKAPSHWFAQRDMRPSTKDPEFRAYFEKVVYESESVEEVMEKMGYSAPTSVRHHMRKMGIRAPVHWYGHPSAYSPEFAPYFENVVKTSRSVGEAVRRLRYANPSMIWHHLNRLGMKAPAEWRLKPGVSEQRRGRVPEVILRTEGERNWVAALHQGEGCLTAQYVKKSDETGLVLRVGMTDSAPIFRFCDSCGVGRPKRPKPRVIPWKPMWTGAIAGLRAYRVLQEILPYLTGQKLEEAKRALEFFAPYGYRKGRYGAYDIWPEDEFPLRKRGLARLAQSMRAKSAFLDFGMQSVGNRTSLQLDRTCMRIADVLLDTMPEGIGLVEIMDRSGVSWTAVIHHLKHLEENSLVSKERVHRKVGPNLLYEALPKLVEIRELGWVPDLLRNAT